jgi:molybdopterin-binding protein
MASITNEAVDDLKLAKGQPAPLALPTKGDSDVGNP